MDTQTFLIGLQGFCVSATLPEQASREMGYRGNSIAISRDMGPLSFFEHNLDHPHPPN